MDLEVDSLNKTDKLLSCYIFKICYWLSSRYQVIKDSWYCVDQKLLEEIWMFAYELNEENFPRRSYNYSILNYFLVSSDREIEEYFA